MGIFFVPFARNPPRGVGACVVVGLIGPFPTAEGRLIGHAGASAGATRLRLTAKPERAPEVARGLELRHRLGRIHLRGLRTGVAAGPGPPGRRDEQPAGRVVIGFREQLVEDERRPWNLAEAGGRDVDRFTAKLGTYGGSEFASLMLAARCKPNAKLTGG